MEIEKRDKMYSKKRIQYRQPKTDYKPALDSPLIGGYGEEDKTIGVYLSKGEVQAWAKGVTNGETGMTRAMQLCNIISLLEQAAEEFPGFQHIKFDQLTITITDKNGKKIETQALDFYPKDKVDRWLEKWLTVPPV